MKNFLLFRKKIEMTGFLVFFQMFNGVILASDVYDNLRLRPDTITKQQVAFMQPGDSGKDRYWDFSDLDVVDDNYEVAYFIPENAKQDTLCGLENRTRYYYRYYGDTLASIGYENPTTFVTYDRPEFIHCLSIQFGDTLLSRFRGKGVYGTDSKLKFGGKTKVIADGIGTLKLPDGTYENVLRTFAFRKYKESGFDTTKMWQETYRWYTTGCPYPIFESVSSFAYYKNDSIDFIDTVEQISFYYTIPEETREKYNILNQTKQDSVSNPVNAIWANANFHPNPVLDNLTVNYTLKRNANIGYSLHSATGVTMTRIPSIAKEEGDHTDQIDMGAYPIGNYTLYIYVDYYVIKHVIIKL